MPGLSSKRRALKVDVLQDRKLYCLQARPYIFQPGHFTGWSSEGVKGCVLALSERHSYALHRVPSVAFGDETRKSTIRGKRDSSLQLSPVQV